MSIKPHSPLVQALIDLTSGYERDAEQQVRMIRDADMDREFETLRRLRTMIWDEQGRRMRARRH